MAASEEQQSGDYHFVGPVPEELVCKSCKLAARELHTTVCCGKKFCQACIDPVLKDKKPCPSCGEAEFSTVFIKSDMKRVLALQLHCTVKQRGCVWVGQLEQLDAHLDTECQYVDVECPSKCDMKVQKRNLATHLDEKCPKRDYMCPHCNYEATFEIVSDKHIPECLLYPVRCHNLCGVTCEREFIEDHMQMCSLEEIECELSYAGCKERFLRQDQDEHMQQNAMKHTSLMAAANLRIRQEFEQKLKEKDDEMKQELKRRDEEMQQKLKKRDDELKATLEEQVKNIEDKLLTKLQTQDKNHSAVMTALKKETNEQLQQAISTVKREAGLSPYHRTLGNYTALKAKGTHWNSEPFYTCPLGYKCHIKVWPNGYRRSVAYGTHVTVEFFSVPGPFDDTLPWPAKATITLHLLNQHRDQDHWTVTKRFEWNKPRGDSYIDYFSNTFILHAELGWNVRRQTRYLKNDCLRFRIGEVELYM